MRALLEEYDGWEAFISPGDSSEETVVFICAASRLHVRSAAALPLVSEASMAAPAWEAARQRAAHPLPHPCAACRPHTLQ